MTNKFVQTMGNITHTENAMPTYKSSLDPTLDLFYRVGNRNVQSYVEINIPDLTRVALDHNQELAVKILGWSRSIRDGAGVRCHMRDVIQNGIIPADQIDWSWFGTQGYWKDIFFWNPETFDASTLNHILDTIKSAIVAEDNLILKWLPRKKKVKGHKNNLWIRIIRNHLNLTDEEYRKMCSSFKTPETLMCAGEWDKIDYSSVPSKCMIRNKKLFIAHDAERFEAFANKAAAGEVSIKAGAIYPHEILKQLVSDSMGWSLNWSHARYDALAEGQWKNLPNKFKSDKKIMVVGDTSGSMVGDDSIWISLALTIYCSERLIGAFHNFAVTFSSRPSFIQFDDSMTLDKKLRQIPSIVEDTNIEAVFDLILHHAKAHNVPKEDMPEMVLIISDMQFNQGVLNPNQNIGQMIKSKYSGTYYDLPSVVYWNVRNSSGVPATQDEKGVVLFSGASPNSIQQAIEGEIDPMAAMLRVVDKDDFYFLKQ